MKRWPRKQTGFAAHFNNLVTKVIFIFVLMYVWHLPLHICSLCVSELTFNRRWRMSTTPNTTNFFFFLIIFKLIQQSIMVILSCLAKKNQNLNSREKSSVYYWKGRFAGISALKTHLLVINWTFILQILIFLHETTQNDHNRLLCKFENDQKKLGCVGSCGCQLLLRESV